MYLNLYSNLMVYDDSNGVSNNPTKGIPDWKTSINNEEVSNPLVQQLEILPSETKSIFSGTRSLGIDGTTNFSLALSTKPDTSSLYRMLSTSGASPAFRTDRSLALTGEAVTVTINNNVTADFALASGSAGTFSAVSVGDIVWVPGPTTGDIATVFNTLNEGFWVVLAKGSVSGVVNKKLTLKRLNGMDFAGVAEIVTLTTNIQLNAFSASGVQVGDTVEISSGFSSVTQKAYVITEVTPKYIEFVSSALLPLESSIVPGASGIAIYSVSKRFIRIECDQEAVIRFNSDSGNTNRIIPLVNRNGYIEKWGNVWDLSIVNRSSTDTLNCIIISVE